MPGMQRRVGGRCICTWRKVRVRGRSVHRCVVVQIFKGVPFAALRRPGSFLLLVQEKGTKEKDAPEAACSLRYSPVEGVGIQRFLRWMPTRRVLAAPLRADPSPGCVARRGLRGPGKATPTSNFKGGRFFTPSPHGEGVGGVVVFTPLCRAEYRRVSAQPARHRGALLFGDFLLGRQEKVTRSTRPRRTKRLGFSVRCSLC